jgi:hypothetical protein
MTDRIARFFNAVKMQSHPKFKKKIVLFCRETIFFECETK